MSDHAAVLWLTGLSGAGKTTLARALEPALRLRCRGVEILDGDLVRAHLSRDLGFSRQDRDTHVLRVAYVAQLLARNGVTVIVAAISPYRATREQARAMFERFVEVHVATPLEECIRRDVKGLYARAMAGELSHFTGISDPYEAPRAPELVLDTSALSVDDCVARTVENLEKLGYL